MEEGAGIATAAHVLGARNIAKPLEQQVADRMIERRQDYAMVVNSGERVGRVNGLAVLGANSGLSDFSGIMLPVEALVTPLARWRWENPCYLAVFPISQRKV